jgi:ATP-binding cassette subfamily B protein
MVAKYYGKHYNADTLRQKAGFSKAGVSLLGLSETAEKLGFRTGGASSARLGGVGTFLQRSE